MIKGIVFDVDGTLLDSMLIWEQIFDQYLSSVGISPDKHIYKETEKMDLKQACSFAKEKYSLPQSVEEIKATVIDMVGDFYRYKVQCKPGVPDYLDKIHRSGIKCSVATAGDTSLVRECFERLGILKYFTALFCCSEYDTDKTKPDIYLIAAEAMGTSVEETAVYEDAPYGIVSAKNAGFTTIAILSDDNKDDEKMKEHADICVGSYAELLNNDIIFGIKRRCVVVSGAKINNYSAVRSCLRKNDFFVFCDCGLTHADRLGVIPNLIVGDFDSHERPETDIETIVLPCEKDDTDTVYAVKEAIKRGYDDFLIIGAVGGRLDHTIGNVSILALLYKNGKRGYIIDDYSEIQIVDSESVYIEDRYPYFSLLNVFGHADGITIKGAKYPLENGSISWDYQYGISNEVTPGEIAEVSVKNGPVLLIRITNE